MKKQTRKPDPNSHAKENARAWATEIAGWYAAWRKAWREADQSNDCSAAERIAESARESILEITLQATWSLGSKPVADTAYILLSTGGPALRIKVDLNEHGEATGAILQGQDWGTPWTDFGWECGYYDDGGTCDSLNWFAGLFYFGEG